MFSPQKLLILVAIIAAIIYAPRILRQIGELRRSRDEPKAPESKNPASIDTEKCPQCGDYVVAASAADCGRDACPFG